MHPDVPSFNLIVTGDQKVGKTVNTSKNFLSGKINHTGCFLLRSEDYAVFVSSQKVFLPNKAKKRIRFLKLSSGFLFFDFQFCVVFESLLITFVTDKFPENKYIPSVFAKYAAPVCIDEEEAVTTF